MLPSTKQYDYPYYYRHRTGQALFAFLGPDSMFKIEANGNSANPGMTIDHYTTRRMVIKYWHCIGIKLTPEQFSQLALRLCGFYIDRMLGKPIPPSSLFDNAHS